MRQRRYEVKGDRFERNGHEGRPPAHDRCADKRPEQASYAVIVAPGVWVTHNKDRDCQARPRESES